MWYVILFANAKLGKIIFIYIFMYEHAKLGYRKPWLKGKISFTLPVDLVERFQGYCTANGYYPNKLIECILIDFLFKYSIKKENDDLVFIAETLNLVPYNHSILMKELGFNEPCVGWYDHTNGLNKLEIKKARNNNFAKKTGHCSVPTYPQCFEWFRFKSKVTIDYYKKSGTYGREQWVYFINGKISLIYESYGDMCNACLVELLRDFRPSKEKVEGRKVGRPRKNV